MKKSILLLIIFVIVSNIISAEVMRSSNRNTGKFSSDAITYDSSKEIIKRLQHEMRHK